MDLQHHGDCEQVKRPPNALDENEVSGDHDGKDAEEEKSEDGEAYTSSTLVRLVSGKVRRGLFFYRTSLEVSRPQLSLPVDALAIHSLIPELLERAAQKVGGEGEGEVNESEKEDEHAQKDIPRPPAAEGSEKEEADGNGAESRAKHEPRLR